MPAASLTLIVIVALVLAVCVFALAAQLARAERGWVDHEVVVHAPLQTVWDYGSDSRRAGEWSVFFDHITPIEGAGLPSDGAVGALRRCYRDVAEVGARWDETTEEVDAPHHRRIHTFNLVDFPLGRLSRSQRFDVHQHYRAIDDAHTALRFRARLATPRTWRERAGRPLHLLVYAIGKPSAQATFEWNLANIAAAVEAQHRGAPYERPYPWLRRMPWEGAPLRWLIERRRSARRSAPDARTGRAG